MRRLALSFAASVLALSPVAVFADEVKDMPTLLATRGKQVLADDFSSPTMDAKWKPAKGKWDIKDGALHGVEVASDMHAAAIRTDLKHGNAVYQFDFKFENGKVIHLSINGAKGHICRVTISPDGFQVRKDGSKTDTTDKPALLDSCKMAFEQGKRYTMVVECVGNEMIARVDDAHFAFGSDAKVASEKTNFGFPISGEGSIDNVRVWEASANPDWAKTKEKLTSEHPPKMAPAVPARKPAAAAPKGKAK
ncbi:LamG domain-containing protein [Humisphaera borealis]|uniref:3-keto-disaccharide hydrolase domain-containing protein n=1 Tax=Humisphaera borealis TaxID=2807512 RepID=A0A7M2WQW8_9BACT|nr:hypothetical protein [Humisphaera borealis]QOV87809.1 hypothetical protein IPV69_16135 [Humisphaera borealis]